ncbi:MAG TPA: PDZ domain-containing protein [Gemmatimonadaceae bacterium]|nr:PDZ domain-containing protein [Gemmatimonadaceae bacterium]
MKRIATAALLTVTVFAAPAGAQVERKVPIINRIIMKEEPNSARIGVYLGENDNRDTLGVLVGSIMEGSPAATAGLKEGDRIQSIDGVNLRMAREDAEDESLRGMMGRRLIRELDKKKAGDEIELRVYSGGSTRSLRVKTVAARELTQASTPRALTQRFSTERAADRAVLGMALGSRVTKRDTLGVFVASVTPDGPAEKAGIVEGDRIARINGVDLRVPSQEAGESELSSARMRRASTEIAKLKAGEAVTLTVVTGGRSREVTVTPVKASDLKDDAFQFFSGDGALRLFKDGGLSNFEKLNFTPNVNGAPLKILPRIRAMPELEHLFDGDAFMYRFGDDSDANLRIRERVRDAIERARDASDRARDEVVRARIAPRITTRS